MANDGKLTPKQRAFVRALLTERDTRAAAAACGIAERTAYRWIKRDDVQRALLSAEGEMLSTVTRSLLQLASEAVNTLQEAMGGAEKASTKVRAANIVLSRLLQLRELVELERRVSELEEKVDEH